MSLKAIFFGAIGSLVETSDIQRRAFNRAFQMAGLDWHWSDPAYRAMLTTLGGAARIRAYADAIGVPLTDQEVTAIHRNKTEIFVDILRETPPPLRPGVFDLMAEAQTEALPTAFVTTTDPSTVDALAKGLPFRVTVSGEDVMEGKPAPDCYRVALAHVGLSAADVIAIEDTPESLQAATALGIPTVLTPGRVSQGRVAPGAIATLDDLSGTRLDDLRRLHRSVITAAA